jgi:malate dehydrogenase (oxaloacetate-decarboxylating)(NADP+)
MVMNKLRGAALLRDPDLNKFTAFSEVERDALGVTGLLPAAVESIDAQVKRVEAQLAGTESNLQKYIAISALQGIDETLFYRVLRRDLAQYLPIVYTPTVGDACLSYSRIFDRPRGLFISLAHKGRVREILRNWPERDVRFIVVTSGERILGLGDLGANGMGIPIGKLALYTACAGVPPRLSLPVTLDCGTNNQTLLNDPLYVGLRRPRPSVAELDEFVEEFVTAAIDEFPRCCVQFEDWARGDAFRLLARYRDRVCCFNDDSQGSGAVALAGIWNAIRITGGKLSEQRFLFLGAGQAAIGIAETLTHAMMLDGLAPEQARERSWLFNRGGLVESTRKDLAEYQRPYARSHAPIKDFSAAIESIRPTCVIGVSTVAKAFNRQVIELMARLNERPIIFALSNPTSRSECTAEEAYRWSGGGAVFASGSPFPAMELEGRKLTPGQCNNLYIFPAVGLAVYATQARRVTDEMFLAAARAVANEVTASDLKAGLIYPRQDNLLQTAIRTAARIAEVIFQKGLAGVAEPRDIASFIASHVYQPEYENLI